MKCVVTGAAGFIGSHLCDRLIAEGHTVWGIDDLSNGRRENLKEVMNHKNFFFFAQDINNMAIDFTGVDWVFHLAAKADIVPSIENPVDYHHANVTGTVSVLEASRKGKVKKFIYAASSSCYGIPQQYPTSEANPFSPQYPYALTKLLGEMCVHHWRQVYGLSTIALRLFNVYGPRHRTSGTYGAVFGVFMAQIANNAPVTIVGDGEQLRDFTYVSDVVSALIAAAQNTTVGWANIGTGKPQSINYLAKLLGAEKVEHIPDRPGEPRITHANIDVAVDQLNWKPKVSFEDGVWAMRELIQQFKDAPLWTPKTIAKATESWFKELS